MSIDVKDGINHIGDRDQPIPQTEKKKCQPIYHLIVYKMVLEKSVSLPGL